MGVNCLKTLKKLSICLPGKTPSDPSVTTPALSTMLTRHSESLDSVGTANVSKVVVVGLGSVASEEDLLRPWIRYPAIQARCRRVDGSREVARIIVPRELLKRLKIFVVESLLIGGVIVDKRDGTTSSAARWH